MTQIDIDKPIQVAIVVRDLDAKVRAWSELLGIEPSKLLTTGPVEETKTEYRGAPTAARVRVAVFDLGHCELELLEPIGEPSVWSDDLAQRGEGVHHVGFLVSEMDDGIGSLAALGMPVLQQAVYRNGYGQGRYAYFDSQSQLGAMIEFNELM